MTVTNYYPYPVGTSESWIAITGWIGHAVNAKTWATHHDATDGTSAIGGTITLRYNESSGNNLYDGLRRGVVCFDTRLLPAGATISAAKIKLYSLLGEQYIANLSLNIYSVNLASVTSLEVGDYDAFGTTQLCNTSVSVSVIDASEWHEWQLNAAGIAAIVKAGITQFGLRYVQDATNSPVAWSGADQRNWFKGGGNYGGAEWATLEVTYTTLYGRSQAHIIG